MVTQLIGPSEEFSDGDTCVSVTVTFVNVTLPVLVTRNAYGTT